MPMDLGGIWKTLRDVKLELTLCSKTGGKLNIRKKKSTSINC